MGRCGPLGRQTVFHQPDMHAAFPYPRRLGVFIADGGGYLDIAHSHGVHTVDGNLMFGYQVAHHRCCQPVRALDADRAGTRCVCF